MEPVGIVSMIQLLDNEDSVHDDSDAATDAVMTACDDIPCNCDCDCYDCVEYD